MKSTLKLKVAFKILQHDERKAVFAKNLALIEKHNAEHKAGKHSYWLGVNQFADLTNDEFVDLHTGFRSVEGMETADLSNVKAPLTMDWRDNVSGSSQLVPGCL